MKLFLLLTLSALVAGAITFSLTHDHFTGSFPWQDPSRDGVTILKWRSELLSQDRELHVYLPRAYDSTLAYPTLYVLDGDGQARDIAETAAVLSTAGDIPELIVVGIPNIKQENRERDLTPPFMHVDADDSTSAMGAGDVFLDFLEHEAIPRVEREFKSANRMISGHSRGGLLVVYSLMQKPDLYDARFCYSAPLWRQDSILIKRIRAFVQAGDLPDSFLFIGAGGDETDRIKGGLDRISNLLKSNPPSGLTWSSAIIPAADHQLNSRIGPARGLAEWGSCPDRD